MTDLEEHLKSLRLAAPSRELDRRIDAAFAAAARARPRRLLRASLAPWSIGLATAACLAGILVANRTPRPAAAPAVLVYRFEAQGALRQMLLGPTLSTEQPTHFVVRVSTP